MFVKPENSGTLSSNYSRYGIGIQTGVRPLYGIYFPSFYTLFMLKLSEIYPGNDVKGIGLLAQE